MSGQKLSPTFKNASTLLSCPLARLLLTHEDSCIQLNKKWSENQPVLLFLAGCQHAVHRGQARVEQTTHQMPLKVSTTAHFLPARPNQIHLFPTWLLVNVSKAQLSASPMSYQRWSSSNQSRLRLNHHNSVAALLFTLSKIPVASYFCIFPP